MKKIKTVICPLERSKQYDDEINKLLAAGWTIRKRDFINVPGEISEAFNITTKQLLYAELERFEPPLFEEVTM